jgi:hypothetical protein
MSEDRSHFTNHITWRMVITFRRKKMYLITCLFVCLFIHWFMHSANRPNENTALDNPPHTDHQVCLLEPLSMANIYCRYSKGNMTERMAKIFQNVCPWAFIFIHNSKLQTTGITMHSARFTVRTMGIHSHLWNMPKQLPTKFVGSCYLHSYEDAQKTFNTI